ncbi:MAG: magnesium transporter [Gemmatimonas sp.]|nr:magnesium transporter [Gemmatimonas sp.]
MLTELLKPEIEELIRRKDWAALREGLALWPSPELSELLLSLPKADRVLFYRSLARSRAADVFSLLEGPDQDRLLRDLTDEETRHLLANLHPDDRTHLLEELPGQVTQRLLNLLGPDDLREARWLLGYPDDSVGRLMTPDYVAVREDWTVDQALRHIRRTGKRSETVNRIYVVDPDWHLVDDIELRRFILAEPNVTVSDLMDNSFASVSAFEEREEAVRVIRRYDQVALPVLDSAGILVGIVTVDDLLDVAEEEATEDFHKVGSVGPIHTGLLETPLSVLYRRRIGWLLVLIVVNIFSGATIDYYSETITTVATLIVFLPLLIGSAGNAGAQSATLMVRALATGDVTPSDWLYLLTRELGLGLALGVTMALAISGPGIFYGGRQVAVVVALTMLAVVALGSVIGMSLPFLLDRLRLDPATASAPLVTSIADITGVLVYLPFATWYLGVGG